MTKANSNANYKVISDHAEATADGAVHAPLSVFTLTEEQKKDPFNSDRIEKGIFIETRDDPLPEIKTAPNNGGSD